MIEREGRSSRILRSKEEVGSPQLVPPQTTEEWDSFVGVVGVERDEEKGQGGGGSCLEVGTGIISGTYIFHKYQYESE